MRAPESAAELKLGVLFIFAEAQAWAHGLLDSAMAERAALSAEAHNSGRPRKTRGARAHLGKAHHTARKKAWFEKNKKAVNERRRERAAEKRVAA